MFGFASTRECVCLQSATSCCPPGPARASVLWWRAKGRASWIRLGFLLPLLLSHLHPLKFRKLIQRLCPSLPCSVVADAPFLRACVQSLFLKLAELSASITSGCEICPFMTCWVQMSCLLFALKLALTRLVFAPFFFYRKNSRALLLLQSVPTAPREPGCL